MKPFINELRTQIKTRFAGILVLSNKKTDEYSWFISSLLDLLFKNEWTLAEKTIPCSSNRLTKNLRPLTLASTDSDVSLMLRKVNDDKAKFKNELKQYKNIFYNEDDSLSNFWLINKSKFRALAILERKYLSIPASSEPVERLFSKSAKFVKVSRDKRSNFVPYGSKFTQLN
ncbi:zinc finger BED domain-containing DAYSLEEPER-like [Brachionus plicatilis]|uniref:Zinc finger BED domain-containing DAYSLEEPER-like n=1 Tax=Brachionus plicatilis TaxID=10195 RepID=A0A3M7P608_BRAPC|nr:zinc finger BED domain-containing DAYSLEEPER-like [Brachionus plicatilis]